MDNRVRKWPKRIGWAALFLAVIWLLASLSLSRSDGPVFIFAGGPFRTGQEVPLQEMEWDRLDEQHELEMEIVSTESSLTLWFSVEDGVPYVACDLDCVGGVLSRWPQQIEGDNRVVVRIEGQRAPGLLIHVPHDTPEYAVARAGRNQKYSGAGGGRAGAETAAHGAVVGVGEALTGRAARTEPGDRLYRVEPRSE